MHNLLKYVDFSLKLLSTQIAWFVDQCVFLSCLSLISSQNSKLVYSFESLSIKPTKGSGVVHLTMFAPQHAKKWTHVFILSYYV